MSNEQQEVSTSNRTVDHLDVDEERNLSEVASSIDTDVTSLSSSIREHVYENGRRYHSLNAGTYTLPNDEKEQERLDMFHHGVSLLLEGELHVVKLPKNLNRILDLGTGTGIWAIDMADQHPKATVIGVDLSPIQPSWVPPNCTFEVDDVEKPWVWKEPFDFIHSSNLAQGIHDWPNYAKQIFKHLTPGGVVQLHETEIVFKTDDDSIPKGGFIETYQKKWAEACALAGMQEVAPKLAPCLQEAGFSNIRVVIKKFPVGTWTKDPKKKEIGKIGLFTMEQALNSYGIALFTRFLGMTAEKAKELCRGTYKEFLRRDVHTYLTQYFVEGKKPAA